MNKFLFPLVVMVALMAACSGHPAQSNSVQATKTDTVVAARTGPPAAPAAPCGNEDTEKKLRRSVSFAALSGLPPDEAKGWKPHGGEGLVDFSADTIYDDHCVLNLRVVLDYMGAYPSTAIEYHAFDRRTGEEIPVKDIVPADKVGMLLQRCNAGLRKSIEAERAGMKGDDKKDYDDALKEVKVAFTRDDLAHFYLGPDTIVFIHNFDYPHVIKALEPSGEVKIPKAEFRSFVAHGGPLAAWAE